MVVDKFKFGLKTYRSFFQQKTVWIPLRKAGVVAFVGPNNAGKSSLLRSVYELRSYLRASIHSTTWSQNSNAMHGSIPNAGFSFLGVPDPLDLIPAKLLHSDSCVEIEIEGENWLLQMKFSDQSLSAPVLNLQSSDPISTGLALKSFQEAANALMNSLYIGPYRNISNQANQGGTTYYDLPIGEAFVAQWREYKTGTARQAKLAAIDTQKIIAELLGYKSLDISASSDGKSLSLVFDSDLVLSLADVGAGIAQLIFTIVTAATKKPSIIFIDEPELHLHPAMQAKFVEALAKYAEFGVVFATHSIGLARQVATEIFTVTKDNATGKSSVTEFENARTSGQLLGEMSYSQFSAIGGRHLLLVEGTTEVRTFRTLLRKLQIDTDVLIVPLGGSSLIGANKESEMSEFQRIGAEVFVLIDSERASEDEPLTRERASFLDTCKNLFGTERVLLTKRRATENYLSDQAIKKVKGEKYRALAHYEKLETVQPAWGKSENWNIANEMSLDEIKDTDLMGFLDRLKTNVDNSMSSKA